ncbi:hypothetical protein WN943_002341 [Citrus x changshan-huyou]
MKHNYLKSLRIEGCHSLKFIVGGQLPSSLSKLEIRNCDKLQCLVLMDDMKDTSTASSCSSGPAICSTKVPLDSDLSKAYILVIINRPSVAAAARSRLLQLLSSLGLCSSYFQSVAATAANKSRLKHLTLFYYLRLVKSTRY